MIQQLENLDFSQRCDWEPFLLILHQNLLESHYFISILSTPGFEHLSEGSLTNLGNLLILVHSSTEWKFIFLNVSVLVLRYHCCCGLTAAAVVVR